MALEPYEEEVLRRMYDAKIIGWAYKPIQKIQQKIQWREIVDKHHFKKSFERVIRHLTNKGYIDDRGKSGDVASLSSIGVAYVWGKYIKKK